MEPNIVELAERWVADDPDTETAREGGEIIAAARRGESAELIEQFATSLEFGTAGLRGLIGAGPNRMNRAVVIRTTWGLVSELTKSVPDAAARGIVVGFDGRRMSREFAEEAVRVILAFGVRVHWLGEYAPTPLVAFGVKELGAAAGVMVTASHNPPAYNGYKVYWSEGAQIIPPVDQRIAEKIAGCEAASTVPRVDFAEAVKSGKIVDISASLEEAYLRALRESRLLNTASAAAGALSHDRAFPIAYTPLHGVGDKLARAALAQAGFSRVVSVASQSKPDGAFPTVKFPNPEESGAMDLVLECGRQIGAPIVIANDPDADRLAIAVADSASGLGYRQLTGNQVGILLGHYLLKERPTGSKKRALVMASLVSSPLLGVIAQKLGARYEETLTGFKWIANRALGLARSENLEFVFGFEEALGYMIGDTVRDKDGISSAVLAASVAAQHRARGETLIDALDAIYREYGLFVSSLINMTRPGLAGAEEIRSMMNELRTNLPVSIGGHEVVAVRDCLAQVRVDVRTGQKSPLAMASSNVLVFDLAGGHRVIARPSGTEPKIKFYFDVREEIAFGEEIAIAERRAADTVAKMSVAFKELVLNKRAVPVSRATR